MASAEERDYDEDSNCPICFDVFKSPKLLPCRHTFCKTCLDVYSKRRLATENDSTLPCPMCRSKCRIPEGGIQDLLTNFFVEDKILSVGHVCSNCGDRLSSETDQCRRCVSEQMESGDSHQTEDESCDHCFDIPLLFLVRVPTIRFQTNFKAKLLSSVALGNFFLNENEKVTGLATTLDNKCWVVLGCHPELFKIDCSGEILKHFFVEPPMIIFDVACRQDGAVLLLVKRENGRCGVMKMDEETGFIDFLSYFNSFVGHDMALFADGRIIVLGTTVIPSDESKEEGRNGAILILNEEGGQMRKLTNINIKHSCVSINQVDNRICLSDPSGECVDVILESGTIVGHCSFRNPLLSLIGGDTPFKPVGICCDKVGYIIVCDQASNSLFVLKSDGKFCGLITTENSDNFESPFGNPFLISCSSSGEIWLGDRENGDVKIYSIEIFVNCLDAY